MIGIIFNHDMRDDPYNQKLAKSGAEKLEKIAKDMGEKIYMSVGTTRNMFLSDSSDEYVVVQHTCDLTNEMKEEIAGIIFEMLTIKKSYKIEVEKIVVFDKKSSGDVFEC